MKNEKVRILVEGAIVAAICFILQLTLGKLLIWPPTYMSTPQSYFSLVPLVVAVFAYKRGFVATLYMAVVLMVISTVAAGNIWFAPSDSNFIVLLDLVLEYPVAYMAYAIPGLFSRKVKGGSLKHFIIGLACLGVAKWLIHGAAGYFWISYYVQGEDYPGTFFAFTFFVFNSVYLVDALTSIIVGSVAFKRLHYIIEKM